ncbi:MAG: ABC transporter ATP-binding protein/permease [Treponema sp.]|nr:ABC transporter ATP-binding protein/permease [Treponema sp.]
MVDSVTASIAQRSIHESVFFALVFITAGSIGFHLVLTIKRYIDFIAIDRINAHINSKIMEKIAQKPYFHFELPDEMDKIDRVRGQGSQKCIQRISGTSWLLFQNLVFGIGTVVIMLQVSWIICVLFAVIGVVQYKMNIIMARYNWLNDARLMNTRRRLDYFFRIAVTVLFAKEIKIFGIAGWIKKRYDELCKKYNIGHKKYIKKAIPLGFGSSVGHVLLNIISLYIIITKGLANGWSVGTVLFYTTNLSMFSSFIESITSSLEDIYGSGLYTSDLRNLLVEKYDENPAVVSIHGGFKNISVENVSFTYPGTSRQVLYDVNVSIEHGESVCVVGRNGMGKSTLVKLLMGLYTPDSGSISIDGKNIALLRKEGIQYASATFQDYAKYALTLKENVCLDQDIPDDEVMALLKEADMSEKEIAALPHGLHTYLNREFDEDGVQLSEGQWQRVAVARALCRDTPLVILDEPTSNLDPVSEENIYNIINAHHGSKTVIMVSHRLSGAARADKIIVVDNGGIAGVGTHAELMETCEIYRTMFTVQARRYQ